MRTTAEVFEDHQTRRLSRDTEGDIKAVTPKTLSS